MNLQLPRFGASEGQSCLPCTWESPVCSVADARAFTQGMQLRHIQKSTIISLAIMMMVVLTMPNVLLQVAAIEAVTSVIDSKLIPGNDVVDLLLPSVLANINVVGTPDEVRCPAHWQLPAVLVSVS